MFKRIALFILTNLAVLIVLSVILRLLGLDYIPYGTDGAIPYTQLLGFAAVVGFSGSLISLAISKTMAKWQVGAKVIKNPQSEEERWLIETVRRLSQQARIGMPEVAMFESPDPNAFATGARRNHALVAVSTGLLRNMHRSEVEAVVGHEIAHVANGDMVTLALLQGVVNTFVIFLSRVIGFVVDRALSRGEDRRGPGPASFLVTIVAQVVLGILATMIVMWFSRRREYRADAGGAQLTQREQMVGALQRLQQASGPSALPTSLTAFGIHNGGLRMLFSSHPPLEQRIAALQANTYVGQGLPT